jgi:hypothetical protein
VSNKRADTVAQFILDEINSTKSLEFADLFLVFIDAYELGNSIRAFLRLAFSFIFSSDAINILEWMRQQAIRHFQP